MKAANITKLVSDCAAVLQNPEDIAKLAEQYEKPETRKRLCERFYDSGLVFAIASHIKDRSTTYEQVRDYYLRLDTALQKVDFDKA